MNRGKGKGKGKGKEEDPGPQEFAPPREPLEKVIKTPAEELEDLKRNYVDKEVEYFPVEIKQKYQKVFNLFDQDEDGLIDYS